MVFFTRQYIHTHAHMHTHAHIQTNVLACAGADNIIPMEIALKIANKIRANERFAAYIVVPMWPEGVPTGAATQRILFWQVGSNYYLTHVW